MINESLYFFMSARSQMKTPRGRWLMSSNEIRHKLSEAPNWSTINDIMNRISQKTSLELKWLLILGNTGNEKEKRLNVPKIQLFNYQELEATRKAFHSLHPESQLTSRFSYKLCWFQCRHNNKETAEGDTMESERRKDMKYLKNQHH